MQRILFQMHDWGYGDNYRGGFTGEIAKLHEDCVNWEAYILKYSHVRIPNTLNNLWLISVGIDAQEPRAKVANKRYFFHVAF